MNHYDAFKQALDSRSVADAAPRSEADFGQTRRLSLMDGQTVVMRDWELTDSGLRLVETEAVLIVGTDRDDTD